MPLTHKGRVIKRALVKRYGKKKGTSILYAGKNSGRFTGIDRAQRSMYVPDEEDMMVMDKASFRQAMRDAVMSGKSPTEAIKDAVRPVRTRRAQHTARDRAASFKRYMRDAVEFGEPLPKAILGAISGTEFKHRGSATGRDNGRTSKVTGDEHIGFKKLTHELEGKGNSAESSKRIAAAIGQKKYGAKGMARKAAAGRTHH